MNSPRREAKPDDPESQFIKGLHKCIFSGLLLALPVQVSTQSAKIYDPLPEWLCPQISISTTDWLTWGLND